METIREFKTHRSTPLASPIAKLGLGLACLALNASALAQTCPAPSNRNLFNVSLCIDGQVETAGSNNLQNIIDQIDEAQLRSRFPNYQEDVSGGQFRVDIRGLPATLSYDYNSTVLAFSVPSIGINETFNGGTRDASNDLFEDYIKQNGDDILRELLRVSAVDPLAGNPASLQSQMAADSFSAGFGDVYDSLPPGHSFGIGARFGIYSVGGFDENVFTLPISYSYTFTNHDKLIVRAPLTYIDVDGATAYRGQLGVSYKKYLHPRWALTPTVSYGVTGSDDLGSLGHIFSGAVTSDLMLYQNSQIQVSMGNMVGYYLTLPIRLGDYSVDYNLENTIVRNGLLLSVPLSQRIWNREFSVDVFVTDTRFFGDELYSDNYQEIGISLGPVRSADNFQPNVSSHPIGIGLKYITGDGDIDGFELNFGYRF